MSGFEWEYILRQAIDTAIRTSIDSVYKYRNIGSIKAYSSFFDHFITNGRKNWDLFVLKFRNDKRSYSEIEKQNTYEDLTRDFYPMIDNYLKWHKENENEFQKFGQYNPYKFILEFCKDTKKEIESLKKKSKTSNTKHVEVKSFKSQLSKNQYKYLFKEFTQTHQFIDDMKTDETDFINVFTKKFNEHDSKIYFIEETTQIAYIFYLLKSHFDILYKSIEVSEKFISKDNSIISSNNISSQLSKTVKQGIPVKNNDIIKEIIMNIPEFK